jgi:CheY-like chemotaxis protein
VKLILIVEDDFDLARTLGDVLESEGYGVAIALDGRDALDQLRSGLKPDLILLDMTMPVMDGWRFREAQSKMPGAGSIPVVTVTADGDARGKAASIRAAGYLAKPTTIRDLLDEVERVCGGRVESARP